MQTPTNLVTMLNDQTKHNITAIKIGDCDITPSPSAQNIGVVFDAEMSMAAHAFVITISRISLLSGHA